MTAGKAQRRSVGSLKIPSQNHARCNSITEENRRDCIILVTTTLEEKMHDSSQKLFIWKEKAYFSEQNLAIWERWRGWGVGHRALATWLEWPVFTAHTRNVKRLCALCLCLKALAYRKLNTISIQVRSQTDGRNSFGVGLRWSDMSPLSGLAIMMPTGPTESQEIRKEKADRFYLSNTFSASFLISDTVSISGTKSYSIQLILLIIAHRENHSG